MARRANRKYPRWLGLLQGAVPPGAVYRFATWRRPSFLGSGQLVVLPQHRGSVRIRYVDPNDPGRAECMERQTWALDVLARCGVARGTLLEDACVAHGDAACEYLVTWADRVRLMPAALAGMLIVLTLVATSLANTPATWLLVPAVTAAEYAADGTPGCK